MEEPAPPVYYAATKVRRLKSEQLESERSTVEKKQNKNKFFSAMLSFSFSVCA